MIDTDRMKAAFAATPLCRAAWAKKGDNGGATKLCAISALVSFAGVQPELIQKMQDTEDTAVWAQMVPVSGSPTTGACVAPRWVTDFALPVLRAEYGIPRELGVAFPMIFDGQENEWKGVTEVLALCERRNMDMLHMDALTENAFRYPQKSFAVDAAYSVNWTKASYLTMLTPMPVTHLSEKPKGQTAKGMSKFWTASKKLPIPKKLAGV